MDIGSGEVLLLQPKTDDQGSIEFGDGTTDMDVKVHMGSVNEFCLANVGNKSVDFGADGNAGPDVRLFGGTAGSQLLWDASADTLILDAAILGEYLLKAPVAKTGAYTLLEDDSGTVFTTEGAGGDVEFTLPAVSLTGFHAWFFNTNATEREMKVSSAAGNDIIAANDKAASSVTFTTAGEQIGQSMWMVSNGTVWLCFMHLGLLSTTVTIA
ncbi:MAG: hypothetical protein V3S55_09405 [Nitrospiraceae bacterium]